MENQLRTVVKDSCIIPSIEHAKCTMAYIIMKCAELGWYLGQYKLALFATTPNTMVPVLTSLRLICFIHNLPCHHVRWPCHLNKVNCILFCSDSPLFNIIVTLFVKNNVPSCPWIPESTYRYAPTFKFWPSSPQPSTAIETADCQYALTVESISISPRTGFPVDTYWLDCRQYIFMPKSILL